MFYEKNKQKLTTIRGLASLFELQDGLIRGQLLFRIYDLFKYIPQNDYNNYYNNGVLSENMPALYFLIISSETTQLQNNEANFIFLKIFLCRKTTQLQNNEANFFFFTFLKFTWKIGNRLHQKEEPIFRFFQFSFFELWPFQCHFSKKNHPNFRL